MCLSDKRYNIPKAQLIIVLILIVMDVPLGQFKNLDSSQVDYGS